MTQPTGNARARDDGQSSGGSRELLAGWLGWAAIGVYLAMTVAITVYVLATGLNGAILFLLWIVGGGFVAVFVARRVSASNNSANRD